MAPDDALLRASLKSQYHASLAMLREAIQLCPEDDWQSDEHANAFWQVAYHTLYFTHLYLMPGWGGAFHPWEHHQNETQNPDGIAGPPDGSSLPLLPKPYSKAQVLAYWSVCDGLVDDAVDALDLGSPESGFSWYRMSKLEHQLVNLRHVAHHAGQLADRVRASADVGVRWVGSRPRPDASPSTG